MARGRYRAAYFGRTKGHSILPQRSYGLLAGRSSRYLPDEDYPVPGTYRPSSSFYHGSDYYVADAMSSNAAAMSTDTVYDNIDLAARSRGKDKRLMTQVNAALNQESVPLGSKGNYSVKRATNQRLLQRYFPESPHDYHPILTLRERDTLSGLPEYRKPPIPPLYRPPRVNFDEPSRKVGGGGSLRQWLAEGLSKTRTMFKKDGEGSSEFRWLDSPSMGELDSPSESLYSDPYDIPYSEPYSSYDLSSPTDSGRQSPIISMYEDVRPDDLDSDAYYTPTSSFRQRKLRTSTPRALHSVQQLRRRRRRRERSRTPSYLKTFPMADDISDAGSDIGSDPLDDYPLSLESIRRQTSFLPYEPAPPYPTTKIFSDYGSSLSKLPSLDVKPSPSLMPYSSDRVTPSAILFNDIVSATRRRALASIPGPSDFDTSDVIFSIETPLSHRPRTSTPRRLEFKVPVVLSSPLRSSTLRASAGDEIASFRPSKPLVLETNRNAIDLSKPVVLALDGGDDFFSKFLSQRKQFRDSILRRLDDDVGQTRSVVPARTSSYYTAPYRAILTSRHSPEPQITRDRDRRKTEADDDVNRLPRINRLTYPVRAIVSVSSTRDPLPRYSTYDRVRPTENDDDSMSLVPVSRSYPSRTYSCERESEEPTGTLTTLDRIRLKAYATPSTPARARASRRAQRQQQPPAATTPSSTYYPYRVPVQVPFIAISPDRSRTRERSLSPEYIYRRPVGGRALARSARRAVSVFADECPSEPVRGRAPTRASPVRYLPWYISPQREAELALSPTRLDNTRSRDIDLYDEPYPRGFRFAYPYRTAIWGKSKRRYPFYQGRFWGYPWGGSRLSGYPFGNTRWIVSPSTAATLGVAPVRAGRENIDPMFPSSWFWGPYDALDYDEPKARLRNWNWPLYDPKFDITPAEATRFGIDATTAAKWNAASPIRTGRWDMTPAEGMAWDSPEERLTWPVYPLRAGSPRGRRPRSLSPISSSSSRALSGSEASRWGITPSEAAYWDMYPSSRRLSLERYERARSLSPFRYDWEIEPYGRYRYFPRSRSLSPYVGYGIEPPYSVPRWKYPSIRPRDVTPIRFSPLPQKTRRHYATSRYATPRYAKKAIVPTKAARRAAARRYGYVPRPPVVFVYLDKGHSEDRVRSRSEGRTGRISPGTVAQMLRRFEPRKPFEDEEYSGKVAAARAIARSMTVIPQGSDYQAAIISPNVEIETKRKSKGPKSKYAAAVMRELRLNPKEDIDYTPAYNADRYDRFNLRARQRAQGVYSPGTMASKATPKPSSGKAIRNPEGYSKPKNLLSWQYRIDSYLDPTDVFYTPSTVYKMRDRVREAQEKLDLHRQMLDRYLQVDLGPGDDVAARIARKQRDLEDRQPVIEEYVCDIKPPKLLIPKEPPFRIYIPKDSGGKGSAEGSSGGATSALRQRLRKVVCKTRNDPTYYKD